MWNAVELLAQEIVLAESMSIDFWRVYGQKVSALIPISTTVQATGILREISACISSALEQRSDLAALKESVVLKIGALQEAVSQQHSGAPSGVDPAQLDPKSLIAAAEQQLSAIEELETCIVQAEKSPGSEPRQAIQRLLHTLKGDAGLLGMQEAAEVCHQCEDAMARSPAGWVDVLLSATDWLAAAYQHLAGSGSQPARWKSPTGAASLPPVSAPMLEQAFDANELPLIHEFVHEASEHLETAEVSLLALETKPGDHEALNSIFRAFHTIKGIGACLNLTDITELAHRAEDVLERARRKEVQLCGAGIDLTFDAIDLLKQLIQDLVGACASGRRPSRQKEIADIVGRLESAVAAPVASGGVVERAAKPVSKLGQILVQSGLAAPEVIEQAVQKQQKPGNTQRLGEQLVRDRQVSARAIVTALRTQHLPEPQLRAKMRAAIKVDSEKLDRLLDMVGELVIAESIVARAPELRAARGTPLIGHIAQLDKITRELQDLATSLRMVPIRPLFQKMSRLVRDLAHKTGKSVDLITSGEDTELDKSVIEHISDPLVHMIRNAVDHGIEAAEKRREAGKAEAGRVCLRAYHKGGSIHIEIEDDGCGLDREAILRQARARGLLREEDAPSDRDIYNLIFLPGFSTSTTITDLSGRGVGMDVVKRNVEALRGQVDIRTRHGAGSVFTIRLPLTMAIIDGMVVRVGVERYILPTLSVVRSVRPAPGQVATVLNRGELLRLGEQVLPLFRLDRIFEVAGATQNATEALVCVVEDEGSQIGLLVDELIGQQQVVIKTLGPDMQGLPGISGGAIMPDGQVGLILDVGGLVRLARQSPPEGSPADATSRGAA
ncbi:MAG TPA: Hpt domain-containing protein [Planctomycetota bacterium]|jgi:two-component system chemotaxis sensor kinase CheA